MSFNANFTDKSIAAEILGIPISDDWSLSRDDNSGLYIAHYVPRGKNATPSEGLENVRGVVLDLATRTTFASSYGYTTTIVRNNIDSTGPEEMTDINGKTKMIDLSKCKFRMGFEGALIRVFKFGGKVFKSSHRKIDIQDAYWGDAFVDHDNEKKSFGKLFDEVTGNIDNVLFDENKSYSPFCHYFLLCDKSLVTSSKITINSAFVVYLGYKKHWNPETNVYPSEKIDLDVHCPDTTNQQIGIYEPPHFTVEEANRHLKYGFGAEKDAPDVRLYNGEFLIAYDESGDVAVKIHSVSYQWRVSLRSTNSSLWGRVFDLFHMAHKTLDSSLFPSVKTYPMEVLRNMVSDGSYEVVFDERSKVNFHQRFEQAYTCMLSAIPDWDRCRMLDLVNKVQEDIKILTKFLVSTYKNRFRIGVQLPNEIQQFLQYCEKRANADIADKKNIDKSGKVHNYQDQVLHNISKILPIQSSKNIKKMIRFMIWFNKQSV